MILQVNLNLVIRITILSCLILSACRQEGATQAVVNPTAATESATVQMRKRDVTTAATTESRRAAWPARASRSPPVRSVRKVAPWNANRRTTVTPAKTV